MEPLEVPACSIEEFLDFPSDGGRDFCGPFDSDEPGCSLPESEVEELPWISNADLFPTVDTIFDPHSDSAEMEQLSPVSVLESPTTTTTTTNPFPFTVTAAAGGAFIAARATPMMGDPVPVKKARSKRHRTCRRNLRCLWIPRQPQGRREKQGVSLGRRCQHCGAEKTPQWRAGPAGPKTLCNACGVRFKSGRLCPEYRPASSPTFLPSVHSNSHRKILEMKRQQQRQSG